MSSNYPVRPLAYLGCTAAVALFWLGGGCDGGSSGRRSVEDNAMVPEFSVSGVRHLAPIQLDPSVGLTDCGYSASFKGRSAWLFGDTIFYAENEAGRLGLCNSIALTLDIDAGDGIAALNHMTDSVGAPQQFIELTEAEREYNRRHHPTDCTEPPCGTRWAIWPGHIATHPSSDSAYVFYHKVLTEPGFLNFHDAGHSLAVWDGTDRPAERPEVNVDPNDPTILFPNRNGARGHAFASAALVVEDMIYAYACEYDDSSVSSPCRLARVPFGQALDRKAWQFYSGDHGWSSDIASAQAVFDGCEIASVFYNTYLRQYIAIYSEPVTNRVMLRSASRPEGPWTEARLLFDAKPSSEGYLWIYDALAHPEFSEDGGRVVYVTYTRRLERFKSELNLVAVEFLVGS